MKRGNKVNSICNSSSFPLLIADSVEFDATETTRRVQLATTSVSSQNCVKPSIDDFRNDYMTQYQRQKQRGVVIHFLLAIYTFGALASICDAGTDHEQASHGLWCCWCDFYGGWKLCPSVVCLVNCSCLIWFAWSGKVNDVPHARYIYLDQEK